MSNYETIIIYSVKNGEEAAKALSEKFQKMMEKNGTVDSVDEWGKRRLAYLINDEEDGYYVLYNHSCEAGFPAELERVLGITEGVLRSMVIKK